MGFVDRDRHSEHCKICQHPQRSVIEQDVIDNVPKNTTFKATALKYGINTQQLARHLKWMEKKLHTPSLVGGRVKDPEEYLERMMGRSMDTAPSGSAGISAARALHEIRQKKGEGAEEQEAVLNAFKEIGHLSEQRLDWYIARIENFIQALENRKGS